MYEHVAQDALQGYFAHAWRLLKPRGVFLAHGIARSATDPPRADPSFLETYVFPDHGLVPVSTMLTAAERAGLEVRDVESLREHYMLTLRRWRERLDANRDEASGSRTRPSTASGGSCSPAAPTASRRVT